MEGFAVGSVTKDKTYEVSVIAMGPLGGVFTVVGGEI